MRKTFGIKIYFTDTPKNYVFQFRIEGKPIKHKFILTFSRVFWEYPYNEYATEIFRLREQGVVDGIDYSHKSFMELYHLMHACYYNGWGMGHALFCGTSTDVSKRRMTQVFNKGVHRVHDVYPDENDYQRQIKHYRGNIDNIDWTVDFKERVVRYSENFQRLRKIKRHEKNIRRRGR